MSTPPVETPTDVLAALIVTHTRRRAELIQVTARMGERFTALSGALQVDALLDEERALTDACSDALALAREAAALRATKAAIDLLCHIIPPQVKWLRSWGE